MGPPISDMDRRAEVLALDVPQRHVDARQRRDGEPLLALVAEVIVEVHPDAIAGERVGADEVRTEGCDDGRVERGRPEALAPADGAVLADDLDQAGACASPCC